jgi:hypothetical protein
MGNSPIYRDFTVIDLKSGEKIYEGIYVFDIGMEIKDKVVEKKVTKLGIERRR